MGTNPIKIKNVGRREIWMNESEVGVPALKYYLVWGLIGGVSFLCWIMWAYLYWVGEIPQTIDTPPPYNALIVLGVMVGIMGGLLQQLLNVGMRWELAYNIYIKGEEPFARSIRIQTPETYVMQQNH